MTPAYIGLGANLGDAGATLRRAAADIAHIPRVHGLRLSPFYSTAPVDSSGPDYINAVAVLRTALSARELLRELQRIELQYGRTRPYRNAPRTLDLDLLLYGSEHIEEPDLVVPHPRMHERAFVLAPLADLEPGLRLEQGALPDLLRQCASQAVRRLD